ncbi:UNVERIFIED_ORG: hypothetical protein J2W82_002563 [Pseudomonas mohnii]|nr:hypothetical protein [Pseudomonas mohnii]
MSNRRTVAMVVNDDAEYLIARGALRFIASMLAPTLDWHSREWLVGYKAAFASKPAPTERSAYGSRSGRLALPFHLLAPSIGVRRDL